MENLWNLNCVGTTAKRAERGRGSGRSQNNASLPISVKNDFVGKAEESYPDSPMGSFSSEDVFPIKDKFLSSDNGLEVQDLVRNLSLLCLWNGWLKLCCISMVVWRLFCLRTVCFSSNVRDTDEVLEASIWHVLRR